MAELTGKAAIVTGAGGGGTGAAIATRLAELGAVVHANGLPRHADALHRLSADASREGRRIVPAIFDVTDEQQVAAYFEAIGPGRDQVLIAVHNAATSFPPSPIEELSAHTWREEFAVIADGAFFLTKHCVSAMRRARWGRVVYVSSNAAFRGARGRGAGYPAAKSALLGLAHQVAVELADVNVTANIVAPSQIDTPRARRGGRRDDESMARYAADLPLGRVAVPSDISDLVAYLVSPAASYVTAQTLRLDGGAQLASPRTGPVR